MNKKLFKYFILIFVFINCFTVLTFAESRNETKIEVICPKYHFACDNGNCIDELRKCDLFDDCGDKSDEKSCSDIYCDNRMHFECKSGECIDREMVCDHAIDCFSEDDEDHCDVGEECPKNKHLCSNGRCIPESWICDGVKDCSQDGSDEKNCSNVCHSGYAACSDGECIQSELFCDGKKDCKSQDDESNCGNRSSSCLTEQGLYQCLDKSKCLEKDWVCDGKPHCNDNSDEGGMCHETCDNVHPPCNQECFQTPLGPKCICRDGFKLRNNICDDINECDSGIQVCDHFCMNTIGNFSCSCAMNYHLLEDDRASCRIKEPAIMLFSVGNDVKARVMDGSSAWTVSSAGESEKPSAVAFDPKLENVYWISNKEKIYMKNLKSLEDPKLFLYQGLTNPENLAVDWFGRNIYISDYQKFYIIVCNIETGDCLVLLKNLHHPRALQLDLKEKYLYFTAMKSQTIERSGLDGSDRRIFVKEDIVWPNGLALDLPAKRIYWVDAKLDKIDSCNYDGQDRKSFPNKDASHAYSLAVWQDRIYWTDWQKNLQTEIHSCRKRDGRHWKAEYKNEDRAVSNIMIHHSSMFQDARNPCDSTYGQKCSHLCLLSPSNKDGYVCACPDDMKLDADSHNCIENGSIPLVSVQSHIYSVPMRDYGTSNMRLKPYAKLLNGGIVDMDYNPLKDEIYFADPKNEAISYIALHNGKVENVINNIRFPISVAVDWLRDNLYWINGVHHTIEVARTSGAFRNIINKEIHTPTDLALDVTKGYLYISDASYLSSIWKCELNGTNCFAIARTDIKKATSIGIDLATTPQNIYWTDSEKNTIESVDEFGNQRLAHFAALNHPAKVYVDKKYIIWTERSSAVLYYASKDVEDHIKSTRMETVNKPTDSWVMALTVVNKDLNYTVNPCLGARGKCHHFCFSKTEKEIICGCSQGLTLGEDGSTCSAKKCDDDQKMCKNGECIPMLLWCDRSADCSDKSDEKNCSVTSKCTKKEFLCENDRCIAAEEVCDGFRDCSDGSDEKNCTKKPCLHDAWRCDNGQCIPHAWRCDHKTHCKDESDEKNCDQVVCQEGKKRCNNGWCIPTKWWCDGQRDCKTGEDENQCPCKLGEYRCKNGSCIDEFKLCSGAESCKDEHLNLTCPNKEIKVYEGCPKNYIPCKENSKILTCIPFNGWCNKTVECPNGEDEKICQCNENQVKCKEENTCIYRKWVCDGEQDCSLGSDEEDCFPYDKNSTNPEKAEVDCLAEEFKCTDGTCILSNKVCDGHSDCPDGIDENGDCDQCKIRNGGCQQICHSNPLKTWCSCKEGFMLSKDQTSCEDKDECAVEETCQQICRNIKGSYFCECQEGYTLKEDAISCKPSNDEHWSLAVISDGKLQFLDENLNVHGSSKTIPDFFGEKSNFMFDPVEKNLFGVDGENGIIYSESSGAWVKEVSSMKNIQAVSFDYINRNIYIARENVVHVKLPRENRLESRVQGSIIQVYNLQTKYLGELVAVPDKNISSFELSLMFREMITCENDEEKGSIVSRNLDGSDANILVDEKIMRCSSLAIDEFKKRIYWVDSVLNKIESVDILGYSKKRFLSKQIHGPNILSLMNHNLVWYNTHQHAIVKCSIRDPNDCEEFYLKSGKREISIINTEKVYDINMSTPCKNTTCAHICVPHLLDVHHCICAIGYKSEQENCTLIEAVPEAGQVRGSCESSPCKFGVCEQASPVYITCTCNEGYEGKMCDMSTKKGSMSASSVIWGLVITMAILLFIGSAFYLFKKRSWSFLAKNRATKLRFVRQSHILIEEDSLSQPPTPPVKRTVNSGLQKQNSQNSNDSAIAIDLP